MFKLIIALSAVAICLAADLDKDAKILQSENEVNYDGTYRWSYKASNGNEANEEGVGGERAQGAAQWVSPEGENVYFTYTADENGYVPQGSHLPTPPPTPDYILKALEFIRNNPPKEQY